MDNEDRRYPGIPRRSCIAGGVAAGLAALGGTAWGAQGGASRQEAFPEEGPFVTTVAYVVQFYPLWFTYNQSRLGEFNRLAGPDRISPLYHYVVAINDDTLYASAFLDLSDEPVILTIPETPVTYSVLTLSPYGDIFQTDIPPHTPGVYALTGPGFLGELPPSLVPIQMPLHICTLIFRADKFSSAGEDQTMLARLFRASLRMQRISDFLEDPTAGNTLVLPELAFAVPFKQTADALITRFPISFLAQLQEAVAAPNTPPLSAYERALSERFDRLFNNGRGEMSKFSAGARKAHEVILNRYLTQLGPTNWIHFNNIGNWGNNVIDRSAITEFIQYANGHQVAAYYHAFRDGAGQPLDGSNRNGYVLSFPMGQAPEASRFWSVTAYTPEAIELVPNPANKYVVASYTPGLGLEMDGSLPIYMAHTPPSGVAPANWLPVPPGPFNVMLRVYGPQGSVANNTYVPPGIRRR
jgi:hypothetical protein